MSTVRVVEIQTVSTRVGRGQCVGLSWGLLHQEIAACVLRVLVYSLASQTNIVKVQLCQVAGLGHSTSPFLSPQMQQRDLGKRWNLPRSVSDKASANSGASSASEDCWDCKSSGALAKSEFQIWVYADIVFFRIHLRDPHWIDGRRSCGSLIILLCHYQSVFRSQHFGWITIIFILREYAYLDGSVAEWLACWTQAQKDPGSNLSSDAIW